MSDRSPAPPTIRFDRYWTPEPNTGCWLWFGTASKQGYGRFWDGERSTPAHRFSYERERGPVAAGLVMDHLCRNPSCVNPAHLEPVTNKTNLLRGVGFSAEFARMVRCRFGHEFSSTSVFRRKGKRVCMECERQGRRRRYSRYAKMEINRKRAKRGVELLLEGDHDGR